MKKLGKFWIVSYSSVINTTNFAIFGGKNRKILDITKKIGKHKNGRYQPTKLSRQSVRTDERVAKGIIIVRHSVVRYWVSCVVGLREEESRTNQGNSGQSGRHSLVRCWSRSSLVSAREKG
jgi:hypothetical protein